MTTSAGKPRRPYAADPPPLAARALGVDQSTIVRKMRLLDSGPGAANRPVGP